MHTRLVQITLGFKRGLKSYESPPAHKGQLNTQEQTPKKHTPKTTKHRLSIPLCAASGRFCVLSVHWRIGTGLSPPPTHCFTSSPGGLLFTCFGSSLCSSSRHVCLYLLYCTQRAPHPPFVGSVFWAATLAHWAVARGCHGSPFCLRAGLPSPMAMWRCCCPPLVEPLLRAAPHLPSWGPEGSSPQSGGLSSSRSFVTR